MMDAAAANDSIQTPKKSVLKKILLSLGFVFLLLFFTIAKLPQTKMTNLIQGYVQSALDPYGIYITDRGRELSVWGGFEYKLMQPTLELSDQTRIELDEIVVTPKLLSILTGKPGAHLVMKQGKAIVDVNGSGRGDAVDSTLELQNVDIGKFGLLSFAGGLKGSGQVNGDIHIEGKLSDPASLAGGIHLKLKAVKLEEQSLMGFQLPAISVSEGTVDIPIDHGKLLMKNVQIGKAADDVQINLTGDLTLNRYVNSSALNLRAALGFSEKVKQTFTLIDSIMGIARQTDGRYVYKLTGTLGAPFPTPETQQK